MTRRIITRHEPPPIPVRGFDWRALPADYDLGDPIGWGATEQEAIDDLREKMEDGE
ncbi:MAG: hypothetical protein ACOY4R_27425 [Pseudomonadota bacterium]